jgi:hypothetical protein
MPRIDINYHDLRGIHSAYVEKLKKREPVIRRALGKIGHDTSVRWLCIDDGTGNYRFRLVASTDRDNCIAEVLPLDLTLEPDQFEKLLAEGKRPCAIASR